MKNKITKLREHLIFVVRLVEAFKRLRATEVFERITTDREGNPYRYEFAFIPLKDNRYSLTIRRCDQRKRIVHLVEKSITTDEYQRLRALMQPQGQQQ